ncbi:hypothetical protein Hanom_Chr01g00079011 [Helianthus anomalus]
MEEHICVLIDSYWYKHHILTSNPPTLTISTRKKPRDDELIGLTIMDCQSDVEMKGLLRFWAHSVASTVS